MLTKKGAHLPSTLPPRSPGEACPQGGVLGGWTNLRKLNTGEQAPSLSTETARMALALAELRCFPHAFIKTCLNLLLQVLCSIETMTKPLHMEREG